MTPEELSKHVFARYPIGARLDYLNIVMKVSRHFYHCGPISFFLGTYPGHSAELHAEYVDAKGVIREKKFVGQQLQALRQP